MSKSDFIVVGKVGSTFGIKGWLKIYSFTDPLLNILTYDPWYIEDGNEWKKIVVNESREHGQGIVALFAGQTTPEQARLLTGKKIAIKRSQLETLEKDEYYWSDLVGLKVENTAGQFLGTVIHLMETGANDVLVVKDTKEFAIPYLLGSVIKKIDLKEGKMIVDWEVI